MDLAEPLGKFSPERIDVDLRPFEPVKRRFAAAAEQLGLEQQMSFGS